MLSLAHLIVFVCVLKSARASKMLSPLLEPHVNVTQLQIYFEGINTVHFINLPNDHQSALVMNYFHEQCLIPGFTASRKNGKTPENDLEPANLAKHSDSEGYVVFISGQHQFISTLRMVKSTNPLARCLFLYAKGTAESAAGLHKLAWKRFGLANVVFVIPRTGHREPSYWSLYNPFSEELYDLATIKDSRRYLRDLLDFKHLQGYPIMVTNDGKHTKKYGLKAVGYEIMQTLGKQMKFTLQYTTRKIYGESDLLRASVDPHPRLIHKMTNKNIEFLHPLIQSKILFAVPKNRVRVKDLFQFKGSITTQFQFIFLMYFLILNFFARFHRSIHGPSPETDRTYLLLASAGILFNTSLVHFKRLRFVTTVIMLVHVGFNAYLQGTYFEVVSSPYNYDINTLDQLLATNLRFVTSQSIYDCLSEITGDSRVQQIMKRLTIYKTKEDYFKTFLQNTHAMLLIDYNAHHLTRIIYDDRGQDLVHVIPEPVHEFYQAIKARKELPFIRRINERIGQMIEAGIVQHEFNRAIATLELRGLERIKRGKMDSSNNSGPVTCVITLKELMKTVTSHYIFFATSFAAFFGELFCHRFGERLRNVACVARQRCYEMLWTLIVGLKTGQIWKKLIRFIRIKSRTE